ncbi:hypothetical protein Pla100_43690 [Neorhodopirellula pilleata]|uniref:Uncharacterized protein n=1 Tax=Neorhodopirellula pilleata TaxID=2714738 RepID=A0A5C6A3R2_9BACT|nr:hypothetical protein Pla100_43690 [Neorhodopirellula pilleata]
MFSIVLLNHEDSLILYLLGNREESLEKLDEHLVYVAMDESGSVGTHSPSVFLRPWTRDSSLEYNGPPALPSRLPSTATDR